MINYYVYRHIRLDKNEPFYIGIGTKPKLFATWEKEHSRAYNKTNRHSAWLAIVAKTEYRVEIIYESNDYNEVREKEKEFIDLYKSRLYDGGTLVNIMASDDRDENNKELLLIIRERKNSFFLLNDQKVFGIQQLDYHGNILNTFVSLQDASMKLERGKNDILNHLKGKTKTCNWSILKPIFNDSK